MHHEKHCDQEYRTVQLDQDCSCVGGEYKSLCRAQSYCYEGECKLTEFHSLCPSDDEKSDFPLIDQGIFERCDCNRDGQNECEPSQYCVDGECKDTLNEIQSATTQSKKSESIDSRSGGSIICASVFIFVMISLFL